MSSLYSFYKNTPGLQVKRDMDFSNVTIQCDPRLVVPDSTSNQTSGIFKKDTAGKIAVEHEICDLDVSNLTVSGQTTLTNATAANLTVSGNLIGVLGGAFDGSKTSLTAATTALVAGTRYVYSAGSTVTATLPTQATSKRGDKIEVIYEISAGLVTHKYGTAGEFLSASSSLVKGATGVIDFLTTFANGTNEDFLNLIGLANAGPGSGTKVTFVYTGTNWQVDAVLTKNGTGLVANTSAFATA